MSNLNTDTAESSIDRKSPDVFSMLCRNKGSQKYVGIPSDAGKHFEDIPELRVLSNYFIQHGVQFTYNNVIFFDLIRTIYKNFLISTKLQFQLVTSNYAKLLAERIDPNLSILESWLRGHGKRNAISFEKGITLLLSLCGYRALHVDDWYEDAAQENRHATYGITNVGTSLRSL